MKTSLHFLSAAVAAALLAGTAYANTGSVSQLSGTLSVKKADGSVRILSQKSEIAAGDTLNTERDTFAQIRFTDGGQITLKPNTSVKIDDFKFSEDKPQQDSFLFSLVKGGLRAVTGIVGKRSRDNYRMNTATATIGIRGTTYSADDCLTTTCIPLGATDPVEAAVYVSVADGEVVVKNDAGEQAFQAGQFGLIGKGQKPLFLSTDPGLQFIPPASFIHSVMAGSAGGGAQKECVVRR